MNPVLGIKDPKHPGSAMTGNKGSFRGPGGNYIPAIDPSQIAISYLAPGTNGIPVSTGGDPADNYQTAFNVGERNIFRQSSQRRLDISVRKDFRITSKMNAQFEMSFFNITNTTSLDVPQNQAQIRQNNGCSATATAAYGGYNNCNKYRPYLGYGQIVTDVADQATNSGRGTAGLNLDQIPFSTGTGKGIQLPLQLLGPTSAPPTPGQGYCVIKAFEITGSNPPSCPNNAANFGSVTGTIGGNRAVVIGFHITY